MSDRLRLAPESLLDAAEQRQRLSAAGAELVDGQGVERVVTSPTCVTAFFDRRLRRSR
jgi:hypothetical protein